MGATDPDTAGRPRLRPVLLAAMAGAGLACLASQGRLDAAAARAARAETARLVAEYRLRAGSAAPPVPREVSPDAPDACRVGPDLLRLLR